MKKKYRKGRLSFVVILGIAVLLLIFGTVADVIGYSQFTKTLTAQYKDTVKAVANEAQTMVNVDDLDGFLSDGESANGYATTQSDLQALCDKTSLEFIYVVGTDAPKCAVIKNYIEVVNENSAFDPWTIGFEMDISVGEYRPYQRALQKLYAKNADRVFVIQNKGTIETGYHIAALMPLRDGTGEIKAVVCVQKQMSYLYHARTNYIRSIVWASIALVLIAGTGWYFFLRSRLLRPIAAISGETKRFADEGTLPEKPLSDNIKYHDELGSLALVVDDMEKRTIENFARLGKITAEKQRVDAELNLASDIQKNMLPSIFPPFPDRDEFDVFATMSPAKEVGGDFYDFFMVDHNHVAVVMADVSGKGVPAALFMVITKTLIKNHAQLGLSPAETFTKVNQILCESNGPGLFITAWMGILNLEDGTLTYANAGHNPPMIKLGNGGYEFLKCRPGFVLAGMEGIRYKEATLTMEAGDRLFLYTDGVTEATDQNNRLYGEERLSAYLNTHQGTELYALLKGLRADIDSFVGAAEQFDDITMLELDYKKTKNKERIIKTYPATDESLPKAMEMLETQNERWGVNPKTAMQISVSFEEMFVNVAHYAYPETEGTVDVILDKENGVLSITLVDEGIAFDPLAKSDPDISLSAEERKIGGLGIFMVKKNMDEVSYERKSGHNVFTMKKKL